MKISTSILNADNRIDAINELNKTNNDLLHIDVMDGKFVNNIQMPIEEIKKYIEISKVKLDIHLMAEDPITYIDNINSNNIEYITIHYEIDKDIKQIINIIKNKGYKVGISIKPNTSYSDIIKYLNDIDMVLIMTVEPGLGGQKFIPEMINKAIELKKLKKDLIIEMDGGINNETIQLIKNIIDISVVGSYITKSNNYQEAINNLKN